MYSRCLVLVSILFMPTVVFAYIDPGILSSLYQVLYVVILGAVSTWIIKPWKYIRSLFKQKSKTVSEKTLTSNQSEMSIEKSAHDKPAE